MRQWLRRLRYARRARRAEADLAEEIAFQRDMLQQEYESRGLSPADAAAAARRTLGSVSLAREEARDVWLPIWLQDIAQDLRVAGRQLTKDLRFTLAVVIALGLGLAVNNTIFTLINTALYRALPFDRADRLVKLGTRDTRGRDGRDGGVSYLDYQDWRAAATTFSGIAASTNVTMNISEEGRPPERLRGAFVSANAFGVLRATPVLGRDFLPEDDRPGAAAVVIIGHDVWQNRYGSDAGLIGRTIRVDSGPATIIGVMPAGFGYPVTMQIWQPLVRAPHIIGTKRDARTLEAFGRLADAADLPHAHAELEAIASRLAQTYPGTNTGIGARVTLMSEAYTAGGRQAKPMLMALMGAVGFVLLIAYANVANLLLARSLHRSREMAVAFDAREIAAPADAHRPFWIDTSMNLPVYLFLGALCLVSSVAFGLLPALHLSKANMQDVLKDAGGRSSGGSRRARRATSVLLVVELALTMMLLAGAGVVTRSFVALYRANYVIDTTNVLVLRLSLPEQKYQTPQQRAQFLAALDERLGAMPSAAAVSATLASGVPFDWSGTPPRRVIIEGRAAATPQPNGVAPPMVSYVSTGSRYFETVGLRLLRGRAFTPDDGAPGPESVIVDQQFVTSFFPDRDPLGARVQLTMPKADGTPVTDVVARHRFAARLFSTWFGSFALIALAIACVGVYALTAHSVAQRTHEIGVRLALGAYARGIVWLFVRRMLPHLLIGLALGLAGALAVGNMLQAFLVDTSPRDPAAIGSVTAVLIVVSTAACLLPARRAARLDPVIALRDE